MRIIKSEPFDFELELDKTALIMIDMQRDFVEPGGFGETLGNDVKLLRAIIPTAKQLTDGCRDAGLLIIHTRECHKPDLSDLPPAKRDRGNPSLRIGDDGPMGRILVSGEDGVDIIPELYPEDGDIVIDKSGKGAFYNTNLSHILSENNIEKLIFGGVTTEVCVQTTMREANDRGFDCLLAADATESYFPEFKSATINMIVAQGGIVGWATETSYILEAIGQ